MDKPFNHLLLKLDVGNKHEFTERACLNFGLLVALFLGFRLWHLTSYSLWTDEIFSLSVARLPWTAMFERLVIDKVHPPLFYVLLKLWVLIGGQSLLWLKFFPLLISLVAIVPFYFLCRELNLTAFGINLALMLTAVNGYLVFYAQEVRMYSLLFLFTICSLWLFARFVNFETALKKHLILLFVINLLLVYTHYFGWLIIGVEGICLLWLSRQKFLLFLASAAALFLCYCPWIYLVTQAVLTKQGPTSGLDWIDRPYLNALLEYLAILAGPLDFGGSTIVRLVLFGAPVLLWLWHLLRNRRNDNQPNKNVFWWLIITFFLPLSFVYAFSKYGPKSIWNDRYLIILAMPFMLLTAIACDRLRPLWLRGSVLVLVIAWSTAGGVAYINKGDIISRVPWQEMVQGMIQSEPPDARDIKVYQFETNLNRPIQFNLNEKEESRFQTVVVNDVREVEGNHFWLAFREGRDIDREFPPREVLINKGYHVDQEFVFGNPGRKAYLLSFRLN